MSKGKEVLKKNQAEWIDKPYIHDGYHYTLLFNKQTMDYQIIKEINSRIVTKGSLK